MKHYWYVDNYAQTQRYWYIYSDFTYGVPQKMSFSGFLALRENVF